MSRAAGLLATGVAGVVLAAACDDPRSLGVIDRPDAAADADAGPAPDAGLSWRTVVEGLDGALLSIWGTSERDVWTVGGPLGNEGFEALVLRFDGVTWRRDRPPAGGDGQVRARSYWWVHGTGPSDVWLVGEEGRITHWDGVAYTEVPSGTDATLFGVWAAAPDDAWAVGGHPSAPQQTNDVVLHWDGASWKPDPLPETHQSALFKVWGASKDDVYAVGEGGLVWRRTGGAWRREGEGIATGRLTTVAGCSATEVYAVGGRDLLVSNGVTWSRAEVDPMLLLNDLNGVACTNGTAVVVGGGSLKLRRVGGAWQSDFGTPPLSDLHGTWIDPLGGLWGVGGQFIPSPVPGARRAGVIGYLGTGFVPGFTE